MSLQTLLMPGLAGSSAGTITFSGWQAGNTIDTSFITYYSDTNCAALIRTSNAAWSRFSPAVTPQNITYNINGANLYALASNNTYSIFISGSATDVHSFEITFFNRDTRYGTSNALGQGGDIECSCFQNVTYSNNAYTGSTAMTGIQYVSSACNSMI